MIHTNKDEFIRVLERAAAQTGFPLYLLEKDYYLTLILSGINDLSADLVFKGGTCLNKIYYSYYRLSEDLDFSLKMPGKAATRSVRSKTIKPIKEKIKPYLNGFGMSIQDIEKAGHNESTQYIYYGQYDSVVMNTGQKIKIEIGLRANPIIHPESRKINHKFLHPFTGEELFDAGMANCLVLKELAAEKMRAAATRETIAPRDFYDIAYLIKAGFDFKDTRLVDLFKKKLSEDGFETALERYKVNLGRSEKEIEDMNSRIEAELLDVLTTDEKKAFKMKKALDLINETMRDILKTKI